MVSASFPSDARSSATAEGVVRPYDDQLMTQARAEAERGRGRTSPNPVVGALIVDESGDVPRVVSRGHHILAARDHAEVAALRPLGGRAPGMTLYVTLEPCNHVGRTGRCTDAILAAGITRVVCGMRDPNPHVTGGGIERLRAAGVQVVQGVQDAACRSQNRGFLRAMTQGRPQVLLKAALSLDGRMAPPAARDAVAAPIWLTGAESRAMAHRLRAANDAILVGSGTVLADDPQLSVRLPPQVDEDGREIAWPQPLRVVVDGRLRAPQLAKLAGPGTLWVTRTATLQAQADKVAKLRAQGCEVLGQDAAQSAAQPATRTGIDLHVLLRDLCQRGVHYVMCEGGSTLHGALLAAGLVDEVALFVAPLFLGDQGLPFLRGLCVPTLATAPWLSGLVVDRLGNDLWLRGDLQPGPYRPSAEAPIPSLSGERRSDTAQSPALPHADKG